jgi:hypothetical protein
MERSWKSLDNGLHKTYTTISLTLKEDKGMNGKKVILFFLLLLCTVSLLIAVEEKDHIVRIQVAHHDEVYILSTEYTIIDARESHVDLLVTGDEIVQLQMRGYAVERLGTVSEQFAAINAKEDRGEYHTYSEMVTILVNLATIYPSITNLDTIGTSVNGRLILALEITDYPDVDEAEPEFRINGCHHGNEWPASEIPLYYAEYLCQNYGTIDTVTNLVNNREIWIIPMLNPDGHEAQSRYNANGIDLNRNYGYMWIGEGGDVVQYGQPETQAMYEFSQTRNFVLGLSYHTYGQVVNYLWNWTPTLTQDNGIIVELSNAYASYNGYWVTNGYAWYRTNGDMNDYSYGIDGTIDWTIELATSFIPPESELDSIWNRNRPAITHLIRRSIQGISGVVRDADTGDTLTEAVVNIDEVDWPVFCDRASGHFNRILPPGTYTVTAWANGYLPGSVNNVTVSQDTATAVVIDLEPTGEDYAFKYAVANIPDQLSNPTHNVTMTPWALGPIDGRYTSIGKGGEVILDMGSLTRIVDGAGDDFEILEGDDGVPDEGYEAFVSNDYRGPWTSLGNGVGSQTFDINVFGSTARYVRIVDDGDGNLIDSTAGYDLEAIEAAQIQGVFLVLDHFMVVDSVTGNNNGVFDPGEMVELITTIRNAGSQNAINVMGVLSESDPYVSVDSSASSFGDIPGGSSADNAGDPFVISSSAATPQGYMAPFSLVVSEDGGYVDTFAIVIKIGAGGQFLIWDNDPNYSSGPGIQVALEAAGYSGIYTTELAPYYDELQYYQAVFVCVGMYPDNNVIDESSPDVTALVNYLNGGGRMYLEGGDVWYWDPLYGGYDFGPLFGIDATDDGSNDLATVQGQGGTFTTGMSFPYNGENNYVDHIEAEGSGFFIFRNSAPSYDCGVANDAGTYKTVGVSWEFSGLVDGAPPSTKTALADSIMRFFGIFVSRDEERSSPGPKLFGLYESVPNPCKRFASIAYQVPRKTHISLKLYDASGRLVKDMVNGEAEPGYHHLKLDTKLLASGVYFYRLETGERAFTKKMIVVK